MAGVDYSKYWASMEGDTPGNVLKSWVERKPDEEAIVYQERRITWRELDTLTARVAAKLLDIGMKKGDRLGILGPNHPEVLIAWYAAARVGIVIVPINTRYRKVELDYLIKDSGCRAVITIDEFEDFNFSKAVDDIRQTFSVLKDIIVYGSSNGRKETFLNFDEFIETDIDTSIIEKSKPKTSDVQLVMYTSGTTGVPKGVVHTHDSMSRHGKVILNEVNHLTEKDIGLLGMPWTHMIGHQIFFNCVFLSGGKIVLMEGYKPDQFVNLIEKEKITWFIGVPTMFMLPILKIPDLGKRDFSSFRFGMSCGFYAPPEQMKLYTKTYNFDLIQLLGSTEAQGMLMTRRDDPEDINFNTIGRVLSNLELRICDDDGNDVPMGEVGELWFKGPTVFKYYLNKPELTEKEKDEQGFWHSGDMGKMVDDQGNVQLVSRKKDVIIRGGFNIYPGEIEAFVLNMPEVQMAVAVGYPDKVMGAKTCVYIMVKPGIELAEEEVQSRFKENLANYKMPDILNIQSSQLPLLPSGKVDKATIKKNLLKEMGLEDKSL